MTAMRTCILAAAVATLLHPREISADPGPPSDVEPAGARVEWGSVEGASGYLVEVWSGAGTKLQEQECPHNHVTIALPSGDYRYRLASLDKFGKPSEWSEWVNLRILPTGIPELRTAPLTVRVSHHPEEVVLEGSKLYAHTEVQILSDDGVIPIVEKQAAGDALSVTVDLRTARPGDYDLVLENPGRHSVRKSRFLTVLPERTLRWQSWIPGLPRFMESRYTTGAAWAGIFVGVGAGAWSEWKAADTLAKTRSRDFLYRVYNDPLYFTAFHTALTARPANALQALLFYENGRSQTKSYRRHQRNQAALGGLALVLYGLHIADSYYGDFHADGSMTAARMQDPPQTRGEICSVRFSFQVEFGR